MKIASSNIQFLTEYSRKDRERNNAFLSVNSQSSAENSSLSSNTLNRRTLETEERVSLNSSNLARTYSTSTVKEQGEKNAQQFTNQKVVSSVLNRFYSQNIRLTDIQLSPNAANSQISASSNNITASTSRMDISANEPAGSTANEFSLSAGSYYEYQTSQSLSFVARGEITTEDGRSINFEFYAHANQNFEYRKGSGVYAEQVTQRTDPLIVNLEGNYNNLSSSAFKFDLDGEGTKEDLSFAGQGSGFLVLDKNGDGKINDGSEMFGPSTGNGFNELADYDEDGNGFIDEGDKAYDELKVWVKDEEGNDNLLSLKEADVAAIGVESGYSPFSVKDSYNNEYGQVQSTGIFVRESGEVGSVQQINLTHRDLEAEKSLEDEFSNGESLMMLQQESDRRNNNSDTDENLDVQSLEQMMSRLDSATQSMLERQDQLAQMEEDNNAPKSLIQQIVEKLEETRIAQEEKEKEAENSQES